MAIAVLQERGGTMRARKGITTSDQRVNGQDAIRGTVERLHFAGSDFSAGKLRTETGAVISFAGGIAVREKQPVILHGKYVVHPKWGRQFEATGAETNQQLDVSGLANYLSNDPDMKWIGPVRARKIAEEYGESFERVLLNEPEQIAALIKVPLGTVLELQIQWQTTAHLNAAMTALSAYGLTHHQTTTLVRELGDAAVSIVQRDPYVIIGKIEGFGFGRIDEIARKTGVAKDDPSRIRAGIVHCVNEALDQGDCYVELSDLIERANKLLIMDCLDSRDKIDAACDALIDSGRLYAHSRDNRFFVAIPAIWRAEEYLAEIFRGGWKITHNFAPEVCIRTAARDISPTLNAEQVTAVQWAARHHISLMSGGAGSGKTFTIKAITQLFEKRKLTVTLCAPTGKAAKRIEQSTGRPAFTIHRLLGYNGKEYAKGPEDKIDTDVLVVDEVSMVDVLLAERLFRAVDLTRTTVVLVGDHNQLPPVGPGNILRDLINSQILPTTILKQCMRQAGLLKANSVALLSGEMCKTPPREHAEFGTWYVSDKWQEAGAAQRFILSVYEEVLTEKLSFDLVRDVQLLTPTHKGPLGAMELNAQLQRLVQRKLYDVEVAPTALGKRPALLLHDKVIQTKNDYTLEVMNGTTGIITGIDPDGTLTIDFEGQTVPVTSDSRSAIQLAYALTIHKSQGSEFPCSIVICHKSHSFMHHRNLLYTGVTRASRCAIIVGDHWGIANCVGKVQVDARKTFLSSLLIQGRTGIPDMSGVFAKAND